MIALLLKPTLQIRYDKFDRINFVCVAENCISSRLNNNFVYFCDLSRILVSNFHDILQLYVWIW